MNEEKNYWKKYQEAWYNLSQLQEKFLIRDISMEFYLNNFLSSIQSVIWMLNKAYSTQVKYALWQEGRTNRLHSDAKIFKELRNISLKEYPIEHKNILVWFNIVWWLPSGATFESPLMDTRNGRPISNKGIITTANGIKYEVDALALHDFSVHAILWNKNEYLIDQFITKSRSYIKSIETEIIETEKRFRTH